MLPLSRSAAEICVCVCVEGVSVCVYGGGAGECVLCVCHPLQPNRSRASSALSSGEAPHRKSEGTVEGGWVLTRGTGGIPRGLNWDNTDSLVTAMTISP